jgi:ParB family chromosome partitioning protein
LITSIPLSKLVPSSLNVRKTGGENISDLAASIRAHGLIQNLTVVAKGDQFEVVAGDRRRRALYLVEKLDGKLPAPLDEGIPCKIVHASDALDASLAENTVREAMHPADQFDAFQAMTERGIGVSAIAASFGCSDAVVKQRLKLAKVSPKLIEAYRANQMTLETLQTFSITDDRKQQERVWKDASGMNPLYQARYVRSQLTTSEIEFADSRDAQLVGLDEYQAAGGFIRRDMFTRAVYLDRGLVDKLVARKLDLLKMEVKAEGWAWVELKREYVSLHNFKRKKATKRTPTDDEQEQMSELEAERDRLRDRQRGLDDIDGDEVDDFIQNEMSDLESAVEAIDNQLAVLQGKLESFSPKVMAGSGAIIEFAYNGLRIHRGLIKAADAKKAEQAKHAKANGSAVAPESTELSNAMVERLTGYRTAAMQHELAKHTDVALALLAWGLLQSTLGEHWFRDLGELKASPYIDGSLDRIGVAPDFSPREALAKITEEWREQIPDDGEAALRWVLDLPEHELHELLGVCAACAFNGTFGTQTHNGEHRKRELVEILATRLEFDMAKHWQPTVDNFLGSVPKAVLIEAVSEACGAESAKKLQPLKKADAGALAEEMLDGTGWLPAPLRLVWEVSHGN